MSNASLAFRLEEFCRSYEAGRLSLRELASTVEFHAGAFEALAFADYKALQSIALGLGIEACHAEEGGEFEAAVNRLIADLCAVLSRVAV